MSSTRTSLPTVFMDGLRFLRSLPRERRMVVACFYLILLTMVPFGRGRIVAGDSGGILAPLSADTGLLSRQRPGLDFYSVYDAGARFLAGRPVYDEGRDLAPERAPYATQYRYPPLTVLWLAVPLNALPPKPAFIAWTAFLLALLTINFVLCTGLRPDLLGAWMILWLGWAPTIAELHMGQFSLLTGTLLIWGLLPALGAAPGAPLAWIPSTLLKIFPAAMAPLLWARGYRRTATAGIALLVIGGLLGGLLMKDQPAPFHVTQFIRSSYQPYAGAQGPQEAIAAVVWKFMGRSLHERGSRADGLATDPIFLLCAALVLAYGVLCALAWFRERRRPSAALFGLFWLSWMIAFKDCWEHHYMILQCLLAFLLLTNTLSLRSFLVIWACCGAPSLWLLWSGTGNEALGILYFLHRPLGVVILIVILGRKILLGERAP